LPYQSQDTGSSFTSNPGYIYSNYGPSWGSGGQATLTSSSNYDATGINKNGPNVQNVYVVPNGGNWRVDKYWIILFYLNFLI